MLQIHKLGEDAYHDSSFIVDRPKGHPVYLLLLVKTKARFWFEGEWLETPQDIAVVFRPGQCHRYGLSGEENCYMDDWMHISSQDPILAEHFPFGQPVILHQAEDYYALFHLIHNEFYGAAPNRERILEELTMALIHKLGNESNTEEYPDLYYRLASLREQIHTKPEEDWTITKMAEMLAISEGYLHSVYQHYFHTTCMKEVIHSRLQRAAELLTTTLKPVEEIASLCGYHHTEHFIRQFKTEFLTTPTVYRKTH